ncbi:PREDICTED: probable sulfate transporter 3.5 isoform X2 [Ipomoea nil]|uniref:probable sulfate transporter 3.5 isoform X2 n=1 Tax=Ipomoea nil TaxID=35883 RepID=UPI00090115B8|nr:PREDICTED: probable sulfate transporter 3.5 isoform X2 [Ipomoea nil]
MTNSFQARQKVRFGEPRSFPAVLRASLKEVLFPDDPFGEFKNEPFSRRVIKGFQYFVPILDWLPHYNLNLFMYDVLAGITIASLAIPQGISYAKLANIPPIIGLYSSFVPPLIYAVFGSSKHLAVGTVAASSLLIAATIEEVVKPQDNLELYVDLVFTATLVSGLMQTVMGLLRLGILVDFLSHSTITGFMGGTAVLICLQQLKGILGLKHFTHKTDLISVIRSIFANKNECNWRAIVIGVVFLAFLQSTRYVVGDLKKGINPLSIQRLNFDPKYIYAPIKAGTITAMIALAEGIAIGRSFAVMQNEQIDGNKEMIAFGLMNIIGSFTSCYLTTGPFSKTAVNYNAGCRTAMSNVVMSICMCLTLLFLAPIFSYTPLVALSAIIASAMLGLIKYKKFYHLYQTDKFDFLICMVGVFGVIFISMTYGLVLSISLALVRALLHVARPPSCKLGSMVESGIYCDIEQYPGATGFPGILILQLGSPIYFANANYIRERILRWIRDEQKISNSKGAEVEFLLLDFGAINSIDVTGIETLVEIRKSLLAKEIKMILINPRLGVMEKLMLSKFIEIIGKESVFLSIDDAIEFCKFSLKSMSSV